MLKVCCALIKNENKFLITQRLDNSRMPGKWEFPGGKIEAGESPENCIIREIKEELNIEIDLVEGMLSIHHAYPEFEIELIPFLCKIQDLSTFQLLVHKHYMWVSQDMFREIDFCEADRELIRFNFLDNS